MSRQDVENAAQDRIDALGKMAEDLGFTQAILFAHSQETGTVVTTWGVDAVRSAQAAAGANAIKKQWGWPEDTIVESQKVLALQQRIAELETLLAQKPVFESEEVDEETDELYVNDEWVGRPNHNDHGWAGKDDMNRMFERIADALGIEVTERRPDAN